MATIPAALLIIPRIFYSFSTPPTFQLGEALPWRPPQWTQAPTLTIVASNFFTGTISNLAPGQTITSSGPPIAAPPNWLASLAPGYTETTTIYAFDGVLRAEHQQELVITQHPVQ